MKRFLFSKRSKKRLVIEIAFILAVLVGISLFIYLRTAFGATYTWDGGGTDITCPGNEYGWSCAQNWSTDTVPTSADIALFDNTSDKIATVDASFAGSVAGVDINSGYDGTITQARSLTVSASHFDQAAGTWDGGSQNLTINSDGNFTVSGGVHTATTGTWEIERNFTHTGGTLNTSSSTITLTSNSYLDNSTISCSGEIVGEFTLVKDDVSSGTGPVVTIGNGCEITFAASVTTSGTITVNGTLNATDILMASSFTLNGSLNLSGTLSFDDESYLDDFTLTCSGIFPGTVSFVNNNVLSGNIGYFTLSSGCEINLVATIDTEGSIVNNGTMNGTNITLDRNFTQGASGVTDLSGKITFDDNHFLDQSTLTCTGTVNSTVDILKDDLASGSGSNFTLSANCEVTFDTDVYVEGYLTNNGTINATNIGADDNFTQNGTLNMTGTLTLGGGSIFANGDLNCGSSETLSTGTVDVILNKTNISFSSYNLDSNCEISGDFTRTDGALLANGAYTLSIGGDLVISTSDTFGEIDFTIEMNGAGTQNITQNAGTFSSPLVINKASGSVVLLTALTINSTGGDMTITNGDFQNSTFALTVTDVLTVNDTFTQGTGHVTVGTLTVGAAGGFSNPSTGNLIVGAGGVGNSGNITLGTFAACPATDGRAITSSSPGNQRSWTGSGTSNIYDTLVTDQGGSATVNAFSSTDVSGNGDNWFFYPSECVLPVNPVLRGGSTFRGGTILH